MGMGADEALAIAAGAHAGFQLAVTVVVYPALVDGASRLAPAEWGQRHEAHSRRITPVVVAVYLALLASAVWAVLDSPGALGWASIAVLASVALLTATAARAHGALGRDGARPALLRRLLAVDRARCAAALAAAALAVLALTA